MLSISATKIIAEEWEETREAKVPRLPKPA